MSPATGKRDAPRKPAMLRFMVTALLAIFLLGESAIGQNAASQQSTSSGEVMGPPAPEVVGEIITTTTLPPVIRPPFVAVHTDTDQQIPVLEVRGEYFDPSGLGMAAPLSETSNQAVKARMNKAADMGFRCFTLRVDWPSVEPVANRVDATRVQELLQYASEIGLKVLISLELSRAPSWFFSGPSGSGRVMVSYLVDPEQEHAAGNDGDLRWSDGSGNPIFYHQDTERAVENLVYSLYYSLKDEPALLGWYLCGPVTFGFPGGGLDGVVGICDYSPFTVGRFYDATRSNDMVYPLPRYSQGTWDERPKFRTYIDLRLMWKRHAFDALLKALKSVDMKHLVLIGTEPVLDYRTDNGYLSMARASDSMWQLMHKDIDGAVIGFRLSSETFDATNDRSCSSAMHLALTINQVLRHKRIALVLIECDTEDPPGPNDISQIASMIKAAGAYPIWSSGFLQKRSHRWSWTQENAIERSQPLSLMPAPKRLRRGKVGILDLPAYYSMFYADRDASLSLSLVQLAIHQRTGVLLEVVSEDELIGTVPVIQQYTNLIYLTPDLLTSDGAKSWFGLGTQLALYGYSKGSGGILEAVDPLLLHQYVLEGFHSPNLEDQLRLRYTQRGATADILHGADAFVVANDPYVFIRINSLRGARYIDVKLSSWPESTHNQISVVELPSTDTKNIEMVSGSASFAFRPARDTGYLYILRDDFLPVSGPYEARLTGVAVTQQARQMRRSVPAALLLAALLGVTLVWMTFQSQQRSLIQAAELVDRRRRIEPIDILDEPEVMAFYKTYISGPEDSPPGSSADPKRKQDRS